jgi:threonine/homoserine/homoserine lactone efflux protein
MAAFGVTRRGFADAIHPERPLVAALRAVAGICLVFSTQVLFQPGILDDWSLERVARGWFDYFAEILLSGTAMWLLVEAAGVLRGRPVVHMAVVVAALAAGAFLGSLAADLLLQPAGFDLPASVIAGDALRWAIFGFLVFLAHEHLARRRASPRRSRPRRSSGRAWTSRWSSRSSKCCRRRSSRTSSSTRSRT